jgi:hypothetical protein
MSQQLINACDLSTTHPFDDAVNLCRKFISPPSLTLARRTCRKNANANQPFENGSNCYITFVNDPIYDAGYASLNGRTSS